VETKDRKTASVKSIADITAVIAVTALDAENTTKKIAIGKKTVWLPILTSKRKKT
jgi:hypothetical protein